MVKNVNDAALTKIGERTGAPGKLISSTYTIGTHTITVINLVHPATLSVTGGAQWLVSPTAAALGAAHLSALNPLTLALSPWIGALSVYLMAGKNMDLKDIQQRSSLNYGMYYCSCRNCDDSLTFIVDRSDWKAFRIGISATVVGAPFALGYLGLRKLKHKLQGVNSKKHQVATALWNAAQCQGNMVIDLHKDELIIKVTQLGCPRALAIIATLFGGIEGGGMIPAIATICADSASGIKAIKKEID